MMIGLLAFLLAADQAPPSPPPAPTDAPPMNSAASDNVDGLQLVCYSGHGGFGGGSTGGEQSEIDIENGNGRIQMPHSLLPRTSHAKPRWVDIKDLRTSDHDITGTLPKGLIESQNLRIDRITGMMAIGGKKPLFVGHCETYDQAISHRAF